MFFLFHTGSIYVLKARGGFGWATCTKTGPNDARRVVWATGTCFCKFYLLTNVFLFHTGSIYVRKARGGFGWAARTKTGPNDAIRVVLATFTCFCKFL